MCVCVSAAVGNTSSNTRVTFHLTILQDSMSTQSYRETKLWILPEGFELVREKSDFLMRNQERESEGFWPVRA